MTCVPCSTAGPWCATGRLWPIAMPCDGCGRPTFWSAKCGHMHCPDCGVVDEDQADAPVPAVAPGRMPGVVCAYPPGVTPTEADRAAVEGFRRELADRAPRTLPARSADELRGRRRPKGTRGQTGRLQPAMAGYLATTVGLEPAEVTRGVALWNSTMRGIPFTNPHRTALDILNGSLKWSNIPALEPLPADALAPLRAEGAQVWRKRSWLVYDHPEGRMGAVAAVELAAVAGNVLTGWDVNAMYASAAQVEMGTGAPELREWPADDVLKLPGFVQVSTLEGAPWSMGDHWTEGMFVPTPLAEYWRDAGAEFLTPAALVWPRHRRWLRPHVDLFRDARASLEAQPEDDRAAAAVLDIVKDIEHRIFGGLLASEEYNPGPTLRRDWLATITSTGQARMFRALDRTRVSVVTRVVGIFADCAWLTMPAGFEVPPGLEVSGGFGKFKPAGRVLFTPELAAAWKDGRQHPLWAALDGGEDGPADVRD